MSRTNSMTAEEAVLRIRQVIEEHTGQGPYNARRAAEEIVEKLRQNEPEVLEAWLAAQAETFVWNLIDDIDRSKRSRATREGRSSVFRSAQSQATEEGTSEPLKAFLDSPWTIEDGSRKRLAELRKHDLTFVARGYEERAKTNAMRAAFLSALAKRVGNKTVSEKFSEEQLIAMWESLAG